MDNKDGMNYAPQDSKSEPVLKKGDLSFAVCHLDHGHIYGMTSSLLNTGAECKAVFEPDDEKFANFHSKWPAVPRMAKLEELLADKEIALVLAAAIPSYRAPLGIKVLESGKHYFTDKCPMTSLAQLEMVREAIKKTGKTYMVCYSERLQNEAAMHATKLIQEGSIGRVIQVLGMGPHRLNAPSRPSWFFEKDKYGGILTDIGSHQIEQYLTFTGETDAEVTMSFVDNYNNPHYPELEDFGEFSVRGKNGSSGYFKLDWFTPEGLGNWGDGRTFVTGTDGYIELRKHIDVANKNIGNIVNLVNHQGEYRFEVAGKVGFPFFNAYVMDILNGTEKAMSQSHALKAAEISLKAQALADSLKQKR